MKKITNTNPTMSDFPLGYWVGQLAASMVRRLGKVLKPFDITTVQWPVLAQCLKNDVTTPSEIGKLIPIDAGAITRQTDKLVEKKIITRKTAAHDRRSVEIRLTATGKVLAQKIQKSVQTLDDKLLGTVSQSESDKFIEIAQKLISNIEERND